MMRLLGAVSYVIAAILALAGIAAFGLMVFGLKEDAMAAAPAFFVAQPWAGILPLTAGDTSMAVVGNVALLGAMLAINPLLFFGLGRWFRGRSNRRKL